MMMGLVAVAIAAAFMLLAWAVLVKGVAAERTDRE
jgi:hypothetical protein